MLAMEEEAPLSEEGKVEFLTTFVGHTGSSQLAASWLERALSTR